MANRRDLKNIACNLLGSFNSRNGSIDGYWAIGVLCLISVEQSVTAVALDVLNLTSSIKPDLTKPVLREFREKLNKMLLQAKIPKSLVKAVSITADFHPEFDGRYHSFGSALGSPYICEREMTDDLGRRYKARTGGICRPHDAKREAQSLRKAQQ